MGVSSTGRGGAEHPGARSPWARWEPLTGIAFIVLFVVGFGTWNTPDNSASDKDWVTWYADRSHQVMTVASALLIVVAALSLLAFFTTLWGRIAAARRPDPISPLPLVAAGVSAAGIAAGGIMVALVGGAMIFGSLHEPGADVLRLPDNLAFPLIAIAGMYPAALSVAALSVQARAAGLFGTRLMVFGLAVAVVMLGSFLFFPMVALVIWLVVVSIALMRGRTVSVRVAPATSPLAEAS